MSQHVLQISPYRRRSMVPATPLHALQLLTIPENKRKTEGNKSYMLSRMILLYGCPSVTSPAWWGRGEGSSNLEGTFSG